jgi:diacylglycerol O-acyltransferase / wax synthase
VTAAVERASSDDVTELVCDVTGTSMQMGAVLVLQPGASLDVDVMGAVIAERITGVPRMRQRLVDAPFGCGRPFWIDDPGFDVREHVRSIRCAAPGDEQAMLAAVAEAVTTPLPRTRPLWSATLVTGLAAGRSALVMVFHHVLADGIGGLAVLAHLVDGLPAVPDSGFPTASPRPRDLRSDAWRSRWQALGRLPSGARRLRAAAAELGAGGTGRPPRCSLNLPTGRRRALAVARVDLAPVVAAAHARGGTVNDVVLTAVAGALRTVLAARGEDVDRIVVSVPVSARRQATATELGNRVGAVPVMIPMTGDPAGRLAAVARITRRMRSAAPGSSVALIGPVLRALAKAGVLGWFMNRQRLVTTFVSNLHGPGQRLSFLGAPVVDVLPVSGISGNVTVAFVALSYAGRLNVTVVADPVRCTDFDEVAAELQRELQALTATIAVTA